MSKTSPISITYCQTNDTSDILNILRTIEDVQHKIDPQQFGCLKGSSTTFNLIDMIDNWLKSLDTQSHYLRVCFIDFKKAFDRIDHNILVSKLVTLVEGRLSLGFAAFLLTIDNR